MEDRIREVAWTVYCISVLNAGKRGGGPKIRKFRGRHMCMFSKRKAYSRCDWSYVLKFVRSACCQWVREKGSDVSDFCRDGGWENSPTFKLTKSGHSDMGRSCSLFQPYFWWHRNGNSPSPWLPNDKQEERGWSIRCWSLYLTWAPGTAIRATCSGLFPKCQKFSTVLFHPRMERDWYVANKEPSSYIK